MTDVALVGVPVEGELYDDAVAVIVPVRGAPDLEALRAFLVGRGMSEWPLPTRVVVVDVLPRNTTGKVLKGELRRWLSGSAT